MLEHQLAKNVVVLGAGVAGLTTAVKIQGRAGYKVSIIAGMLPTDPRKAEYTSPWAGAHHMMYTGSNSRDRRIEAETFRIMWDLSAPDSPAEHCFRRIKEHEHFRNRLQPLPEESLQPGAQSGYSYSTYSVDPPLYINYLLSRFLASGGTVVRGHVNHINQIIEGGVDLFAHGQASPTPIDALILCPGLGARTLGGVEDKAVYPSRGQVVLVKAPWISMAHRISNSTGVGEQTYVVPRRDGTVALGSTKEAHDWYPAPRPQTTEDILERCVALCPELAPPHVRAERAATVDDIRTLIVEVGCGLRPAREGGVRLESTLVDTGKDGRKITVIHNYGHAGVGFETSWGCATDVLDMLESALAHA